MTKTKIVRSSGRFGVRYGISVRRKISAIEEKQRRKQKCIFCSGRAVRIATGIWLCKKCGKKFAGHAYYLEQEPSSAKESTQIKTKSLKEAKPTMKLESTQETTKKVKKEKTKKTKTQKDKEIKQ